ncbi:exodeoxyribonuclease V subunit beta [Shewanella sp. 10N.7]|uniref:exodeoxyribonuclease V subunit beta n=1 Tax=Shewanella sp. 10N.7 TaxID=2885093 RepID=UPI001E372B9D|nr:exodeoxyribonuclease V subunit beta [Shewanella sp. 10N.7]MCC4831508.1 exodeoxyribonuclease V subunit beta [Shewanella sp. 10N.7]
MTKVTTLNPLTLAFTGSSLIEASAGTGKTYTISGLYLRLLLGGKDGEIERAPLTCEQILVVTFTNAATEELRDRIRKRIQVAFKCFIGLDTDDEFVSQLYQQIPESERSIALRRLDLALKSLDEAAIFTIHGFCQRILSDMAFESSLLFESEFTLDDSEFLHHAVRDFWRETCYPLPAVLAQVIANEFGSPDQLAKQLRQLLGATQAKTPFIAKDFNQLTDELTQSLSRFKMRWAADSEAELTLLHSLPLNGARFGKKADEYPKLAAMFDNLTNWVSSGTGLPPVKTLEMLALSGLKLNKGGTVPTPQEAPLLDHIERLFDLISQIKPAFLVRAKDGIKLRFALQKAQRNLMTPDDLLITLAGALNSTDTDTETETETETSQSQEQLISKQLANAIAARFPVALIDEFQDTDPLQFAIFSAIYQQQAQWDKLSLLMIGDPKQAIYAFRGADIHTYIQARKQTKAHYNLETNYRSSTALVNGVNQLFSQHDDPFISDAIPYDVVNTPKSADRKILNEATENSAALRIKLLAEDDSGLNKATGRKILAADAASEIKRLLTESQNGQCYMAGKSNTQTGKPLIAKDIAILVRDRNEAAVMKQALSERQIGAVFLSRDSVFKTQEAFEIAIILRALANPKDERCLRSAMATELMGYSAQQIHQFNQDEEQRQDLLDKFAQWHQLWNRHGIMPSLLSLASETELIKRFLAKGDLNISTSKLTSASTDETSATESGERRLTDFRHLSELLQQKATELDGSSALINWFEQQLIDGQGSDEQQLRLESEQNLVQIVTIHKSKGLEYPVCFVPFISLARDNRRKPTPMLYHQNDELIWDVEASKEGWEQYKQENLAEDLRLLYVALTRPVYVCYLYIANHSRMLKAGISSQLFETAIGYLLGITTKECDFEQLKLAATKLTNDKHGHPVDAISIREIDAIDDSALLSVENNDQEPLPKTLSRDYQTPWRVGSYSGLVKHLAHEKVAPGADDEDFSQETQAQFEPSSDINPFDTEAAENAINRFTFERGANAGSFMHLVLELFDFTQADSELPEALAKAMDQYGFDKEVWTETLIHWYQQILHTPLLTGYQQCDQQLLNSSGMPLTLSELTEKQKLVEMEFYLPISQLKSEQLNQLLSQYGYDAGLEFDELQGMLKGFIDLTFEFNGQFYIADYKSNHLGDDYSDYNFEAMGNAISSHRYNLQYILYTLALHRYLSLRMPHYQYQQHIGGSFYLFLRGMSPQTPQSGVFFDKPPQALIEQLDILFSQSNEASAAVSRTPLNNTTVESTS